MGVDDWQWDASLFAGAAAHYDRGRLPYSPALPDAFESVFGDTSDAQLLDVGCGPGTVALQLAGCFDRVVGVDPDADMLAEAGRLARARGIHNASWVELRAEQLPAGLGTFRAVTFAASFHWMDRLAVAATVRAMLDAGGAIVHVDNRQQAGGHPHPELPPVPKEAVDRLRRAYLGEDRRAGASVRNSSQGDEAAVFRRAGLVGPEVVIAPDGRLVARSIDDVVAEVFSTSSTAPHLFGERLQDFEADLRATLDHEADDGLFGVGLPDNQVNVWRRVGR